jgi:hypothetical protein
VFTRWLDSVDKISLMMSRDQVVRAETAATEAERLSVSELFPAVLVSGEIRRGLFRHWARC